MMKNRTSLALCAAGLLAGAAAGLFAARAGYDKELDEAIREKDKLIAELDEAARGVRDSSGRLEAVRAQMSAAANEASKAADDIASGAMKIEALMKSLKDFVRDAQARLGEISGKLDGAVGANASGIDAIVRILDEARSRSP